MNKKLQKIISVVVSATMLTSMAGVTAAAANDIDYKITSTYQDVDWDTYKQYKADLHNHTYASDGHLSKTENIEKHYASNFDIQAITDHGTVDYGWDTQSANKIIHVFVNSKNKIDPISATGICANGNTYTYDGTYYTQYDSTGKAGHTLMRVPYGNENNSTSFNNAHVCSWFVDYGNDTVGGTSDYETVIKGVDELGGLCVINHPGEYSQARHASCFDEAYDTSNIRYNYIVNKFANLLIKYPNSLLGIDVNSKGDNRTRFDRKLWDILLQKVVPTGRNVYGLATSDAHRLDIVDSGYIMACMPELTVDALKQCLSDGAFFACSYYNGSPVEIKAWADELKEAGVGLTLANKLSAMYDKICIEEQENGEQDSQFEFNMNTTVPSVTSVSVNDTEDTITVNTSNAYLVHWIADGEIIAVGNTIDLDDYSDKIGCYVRAEIIGEGGVIYTQPFTLQYSDSPSSDMPAFFYDFGTIASVVCDTVVHALEKVLKGSGLVSLLWYISLQ